LAWIERPGSKMFRKQKADRRGGLLFCLVSSASGGSFDRSIGSACEVPQGGLRKPPVRPWSCLSIQPQVDFSSLKISF